MRHLKPALAGAMLATALLSGCSAAPHGSADAKASAPPPQPTGEISALTHLHCAATGRVWHASGRLVNHDTSRRRYLVQLAVIVPATSHVLGEKDLTISVPPGKARSLDVPEIYRGAAPHARCVPRVTLAE